MKFIDLFAGLGGFHLALRELGHECVFASEINENLRKIYLANFGIKPEGDIRDIAIEKIPPHDIICAGFPCQPFSKAGSQKGLNDTERGTLFYEILKIIDYHDPKYLIFENVPNIRRHNNGQTWRIIEGLLRDRGYDISCNDISPHHFGIPQIRLRTYIVGKKNSLDGFSWPRVNQKNDVSILSILDKKPEGAQKILPRMKSCLEVWQKFLDKAPKNESIPHPLWSMEFGATYPYENTTPYALQYDDLLNYKGSFGRKLEGDTKNELMSQLPSYATRKQKHFPQWKIRMIRKNRDFYEKNIDWLDDWKKEISIYPSSYQKLEWNCQGDERKIRNYIIQFRASGVRVKRLTTAPSLVAMTSTQVPIIGWECRYMTPNECKRLQSMDELKYLPHPKSMAYEALGNAINVKVARYVAESLLMHD
ncbi:DNA-methyltransferase (dcm) [Methanocella conradii HZ254]|uniref:DNA-methyltransferase (Dcm) n=1 Tax=Methanocella conradii (strain DSM 24694 / JCM 17849 / CGMCC 1.5162 / HZ254) TaxID=1041930 RepID=H8I443_METCZ|nr:DNA (cytosine-5-)-methyltransferase [Methanocella conradii]AFC99182.1 DNA-methyltransferase (dcm) [Methanocella conradii HZ254]